MKILITGTAGFIGFHLVHRLKGLGHDIVGLDNINDYYDVSLKVDRLRQSGITSPGSTEEIPFGAMIESETIDNYRFIRLDLSERDAIEDLFAKEKFDAVINLAAQAGVRYSLKNPYSYVESNISGFLNILEGCRHNSVNHLIYASSSSVYGTNTEMPFKTTDNVDHPVSLYATSKKSNELMAHTYSHLFDLPTTGLRFFTVYGPWGRPDMALFLFTKAMMSGDPIDVYNYGEMERDFTYVDDIVEGMARLLDFPPTTDTEGAPYQLFNIGHGSPVKLMDFINEIETNLNTEADMNLMEIQPGDVPRTWADVEELFNVTGYRPKVSVKEGIRNFIDWYRSYYSPT